MLRDVSLLETDEIRISDVSCIAARSSWSPTDIVASSAIIFVRRGCFRRRADGQESFLDPTVVYCRHAGSEQQIAHPLAGGDTRTVVCLSDDLLADLTGGEPALPQRSVATTRDVDLHHRALVAACRRGADLHVLSEGVIRLVARTLDLAGMERVASGRPATAAARRRLVDDAREALAQDSSRTLTAVARLLHVSPHHLSRIFSELAGEPLSRYRNRLRVRAALERVAEGETSLARLAADFRFADQAHLTRVVRAETGQPPSRLRAVLAPDASARNCA